MNGEAPSQSGPRIASLDGWRAVAVLLVLGHHTPSAASFPEHLDWFRHVFDGNLGVRIFFVLSGLLITSLLLREARQGDSIDLRAFYVRRALRIFPVYFAYLAVLALLAAMGLYKDAASSWIGALTFTRNMLGRGESATVHLWTLAIEWQFYMAWPIALSALALWRKPRAFVWLLSAACATSVVLRVTAPFGVSDDRSLGVLARVLGTRSIFMYLDSLAIGALAAFAMMRTWRVPRWLEAPAVMGLSAAAIVAGRIVELSSLAQWQRALVPALQAVAIMHLLWITAYVSKGPLYRFLNAAPVTWLGRLSYSVYVWQMMFLEELVPKLPLGALADWRLWLIPVLAASSLSYYGLEWPMLRMKERWR